MGWIMGPRITGWAIWVIAGMMIAGLGVALLVAGLEDADKYASVAGAVSAIVGLGLSLSTLVRRQPSSGVPPTEDEENSPRAGSQTVRSTTVGGDVLQIWSVRGGMSIVQSASQTPPSSQSPPPEPNAPADPPQPLPPEPSGRQSVMDSRIAGSVLQIDQVGQDVNIQREFS